MRASVTPAPSRHGEGDGIRPSPAQLRRDHERAVILVVHRSLVRLQVAEAERRQLSYIHDGRELDDLFLSIGRMTHVGRLRRLDELGERTDDLGLPEPKER